MALLEPGEAAASYKAKILRHQAGADFLALQAAAPARLASLVAGLSAEQLAPIDERNRATHVSRTE